MTRIWNDVQSNLGPRLLQCPRSRRLMEGGSITVSGEMLQKGTGHFCVRGIQHRIVLARLLSVYGGCRRFSQVRQAN